MIAIAMMDCGLVGCRRAFPTGRPAGSEGACLLGAFRVGFDVDMWLQGYLG